MVHNRPGDSRAIRPGPPEHGLPAPANRPQGDAPPRVEPLYVFTIDAIRELDRRAIEEYGVPPGILMENAARSVADEVLRLLDRNTAQARVIILCGAGNNGGDGFALARHLHNAGITVEIILAFDPATATLSPETQRNLDICRRMKLPIGAVLEADDVQGRLDAMAPPNLIIDALFGTGLKSPPRSPADAIIEWINRQTGATVVSIDIPSGLDGQTGRPLGACVRADVTVTLVGLKSGFLELDAQSYVGEIVVGEIGAPIELSEQLGERLEAEPVEPGKSARPRFDEEMRGG